MIEEREILRTHILKTDPDSWDAVDDGRKTAEFRLNDRGFRVGDGLMLLRNPENGDSTSDSVRYLNVKISHMVDGPSYGIPEGYAMLSFAKGKRVIGPFERALLREEGYVVVRRDQAVRVVSSALEHERLSSGESANKAEEIVAYLETWPVPSGDVL
jgi:hypothetical protein